MKIYFILPQFPLLLLSLLISVSKIYANEQNTNQTESYYNKSLTNLLNIETELKAVVGSRTGDRDLLLSEVPIDVVTAEQIRQLGSTELGHVLNRLIPGFNYPTSHINDGSSHSKPFSLSGLGSDQVLVLVNGKRQHQSSLMHMNRSIGRGTSSVDLNTIPITAIEKVEVLRDGAAAQYGSDAIGGVINIILKGYGYDNELTASYGKSENGDGAFKQTDLFYSKAMDYDGFFNFSAEFRDRGKTNNATNDTRDQYPEGDSRNELPSPINISLGDPDSVDYLFMINSEIIRETGMSYYLHGSYNDRNSEEGAFFRRPVDSRNNINIYPNGFAPVIAPKIQDYSFTAGAKGILNNGIKWDLGYTHGYNDFHFYVTNTHNDSLGDNSPTAFDSGGTSYRQQLINFDLSKKIDSWDFAGGIEYRNENYQIYAGEESSYILGEYSNNGGAQGFPGFQPSNKTDANRDNYAAYLDTKYHIEKNMTIGFATRYEHYSDFGSTLDGKVSFSYKPTTSLLLRSTISSGFKAPSLTQSYFNSTATVLSDEIFYQTGTFSVYHPVSIALGAVDLTAEESQHATLGLVYQPRTNLSFSADYFYTRIDDRIMLTGNIIDTVSPQVADILAQYEVRSARYFSNAISTESAGVDLRLNYKYQFNNKSIIKLITSYHYHHNRITGYNTAPPILGEQGDSLLVDNLSRLPVEDAQPRESIKIHTQYQYKNYGVALNFNKYGSFIDGDATYDSKWITDIQLSYQLRKKWNIVVGAENLFDIYPQKVDKSSLGIQYHPLAPFGAKGAYYYMRLGVSF